MTLADIIPHIISAVTLVAIWLQGNQDPRGWVVALGSQALWLTWIILSGTWGFLWLTAALTALYIRNLRKWRAEQKTVFGQRICQGCETQRNCALHGCKNRVDVVSKRSSLPSHCRGCECPGACKSMGCCHAGRA